ncbi:MAG: hypothetical protein P4N60_10540 [Verrucomicrobiae bacterium]|nr:hypothetical protein [Verrucomicrobiae bacterium]
MTRIFTIVVLAALLGCATAPKTNRLAFGLSKQQVVAVMGRPASTAACAEVEVLRYQLSATGHEAFHHRTEEYFVRLVNGKVESFGKAGDWVSHKGPTRNPEQTNDAAGPIPMHQD